MADLPDDWDDAPEFDATNSADPDAAGMLKVSRAVLGLTQQRLADLMDIPAGDSAQLGAAADRT